MAQRRNGFALIELLAVIAIIAILASLLLRGLAATKARAISANCKGNLRQMSFGLEIYVEENRGEYPFDGFWVRSINPDPNFASSGLLPKGGLFSCPGARNPLVSDHYYLGYGYNVVGIGKPRSPYEPLGLGGWPRGPRDPIWPVVNGTSLWDLFAETITTRNPTRQSIIRNPSEMISIGDGYSAATWINSGSEKRLKQFSALSRDLVLPWECELETTDWDADTRHRGFLNMLFVDGHVEQGRVRKWYFSEADNDLRLWRTDNEPR